MSAQKNCRYMCKKPLSQCKANIYAHRGGHVFYKLPVISDLSSVQVLDMLNLNKGNKDIKRHFGIFRSLCAELCIHLTHFHLKTQSCSKLICVDMIIVMPGH